MLIFLDYIFIYNKNDYRDFNNPPSMGMLVPVIKAAWSEARKVTKKPYSSGLPIRFIGTCSSMLASTSSGDMPRFSAFFILSWAMRSVSKYPVKVLFMVIPSFATS